MCCKIQFCMIHGGLPAIFSVIESSEEKFPALEGFVLPTDIHVSRGTRLDGTGLDPWTTRLLEHRLDGANKWRKFRSLEQIQLHVHNHCNTLSQVNICESLPFLRIFWSRSVSMEFEDATKTGRFLVLSLWPALRPEEAKGSEGAGIWQFLVPRINPWSEN